MMKPVLATLGLLAIALPALADNGPIPMRDERQPPSVQQRSAERPYALTGEQRSRDREWKRLTEFSGGARDQKTIYSR